MDLHLNVYFSVDTFNLSPESTQVSSKKGIDDDDIIERSESPIKERQKGLLNITITPRTQLDKKLPHSITTMPTQDEIAEVGIRDIIHIL